MMIDNINNVLDHLYHGFELQPVTNYNLFGGGLSKIFLNDRSANDNVRLSSLAELVEGSYNFKQSISNITFCSGVAGINWAYTYLYKENLLTTKDYKMLCSDDEDLMAGAISMLKRGNYDFLHGAIGIAWYFLYKKKFTRKHSAFFTDFFNELDIIMQTEDKVCYAYDFSFNKIKVGEINLSLSHGISSILKFCLQAFKQEVCKVPAFKIASNIIDTLLKSINKNPNYCYFPSTISYEQIPAQSMSRLAWCYGDLGTGLMLYQAGILFQRQDLLEISTNVLLKAAQRRSFEETRVVDAGFCHGASGIAYIFGKLYNYTKIPDFQDSSLFWYQKVLEYANSDLQNGEMLKMFDAVQGKYRIDYSLLEGSIGIALVLQSFQLNSSDWEYCLMLND
jgi:lantibiotic modifying enzyme